MTKSENTIIPICCDSSTGVSSVASSNWPASNFGRSWYVILESVDNSPTSVSIPYTNGVDQQSDPILGIGESMMTSVEQYLYYQRLREPDVQIHAIPELYWPEIPDSVKHFCRASTFSVEYIERLIGLVYNLFTKIITFSISHRRSDDDEYIHIVLVTGEAPATTILNYDDLMDRLLDLIPDEHSGLLRISIG